MSRESIDASSRPHVKVSTADQLDALRERLADMREAKEEAPAPGQTLRGPVGGTPPTPPVPPAPMRQVSTVFYEHSEKVANELIRAHCAALSGSPNMTFTGLVRAVAQELTRFAMEPTERNMLNLQSRISELAVVV